MHCPVCGQQQISEETRYCSKCGFLLTGVTQVVQNGGILNNLALPASGSPSPRSRGVKQGLFIFLLSFLVIPLISLITVALNAKPFVVAFAAILLAVGGLLRIVYALMFEDKLPKTLNDAGEPGKSNKLSGNAPLQMPSGDDLAASYVSPPAGNWRDTNELQPAPSVIEGTTKLLETEK